MVTTTKPAISLSMVIPLLVAVLGAQEAPIGWGGDHSGPTEASTASWEWRQSQCPHLQGPASGTPIGGCLCWA